jgi:hypothetical protein
MNTRRSRRRRADSVLLISGLMLLSAACNKTDPADKGTDPATRARLKEQADHPALKELCPDLDTWDACQARRAAAASSAQAARDQAVVAKYRAMTSSQRQAALEQCFGPTPDTRCGDAQRDALIATAADPAEQAKLKKINQDRTPTEVDFDQLKKLAETGMAVGKPYKVCTFYYPYDLPMFCKRKGSVCDTTVHVDDAFAVASDEKKALYDRRNKEGCFEVKMFTGSSLRITAML